jgi:hypothetical protein
VHVDASTCIATTDSPIGTHDDVNCFTSLDFFSVYKDGFVLAGVKPNKNQLYHTYLNGG